MDHLKDSWLIIRAYNDCKWYPSKQTVQAFEPKQEGYWWADCINQWNAQEEAYQKQEEEKRAKRKKQGGFGKGYDSK